jgi:hypothetical protein
VRSLSHELASGPFPYRDGWGWLYRTFEHIAPAGRSVRHILCRYYYPFAWERWRGGVVYKALGVALFGKIIPTGGITIRRLTKARMAPYTLSKPSLGGARDFYYRACVFETLHLPFVFALLALSAHRSAIDRWDLALENMLINLVLNVYPIMHHRRTRMRIVRLLQKVGQNSP